MLEYVTVYIYICNIYIVYIMYIYIYVCVRNIISLDSLIQQAKIGRVALESNDIHISGCTCVLLCLRYMWKTYIIWLHLITEC